MKKNMLVLIVVIFIALILFCISIFKNQIKIRYNFEELNIPVKIVNDIAYIKYDDFVSEFDNINCSFEKDKLIRINKDNVEIKFALNSDKVYINDDEVKESIFLLKEDVYLPVEFIFSAFNDFVFWDEEQGIINIVTKEILDSNSPNLDKFSGESINKLKKIAKE